MKDNSEHITPSQDENDNVVTRVVDHLFIVDEDTNEIVVLKSGNTDND